MACVRKMLLKKLSKFYFYSVYNYNEYILNNYLNILIL